jgi:hypothetical protein
MKPFLLFAAAILLTGQTRFTQPDPIAFDDHAGWTRIFDGATLHNWDGSAEVWRVENGAITGESSPEHPAGTTYLVWTGGEPADFELKAEIKLEGAQANSGIQYRSARASASEVRGGPAPDPRFEKWNLKGYQADFDYANRYSGQLYEQGTPRGILAWRGQMVQAEAGRRPRLLAVLGDSEELKKFIRVGDWNQMHIIARGHELIHILNGHVTAIFIDNDPAMAASKGLIGLQIEGGGKVKVQFRELWLKTL